MSEEEDYAEYMMSEEDMSSFEMEVDSDVEPIDEQIENHDLGPGDLTSRNDNMERSGKTSEAATEKLCRGWYETGKAFKSDDQFEEAARWFTKCRGNPVWWFKSLKQLIKCDLSKGARLDARLRELFQVISVEKGRIGDDAYIQGSIKRLFNKIVPDLNSQLLFTERSHQAAVEVNNLIDLRSYSDVLYEGVKDWSQDLKDMIQVRKTVYSAWIHILKQEPIPESTMDALCSAIHLETYLILLQLHVKTFVERNEVDLAALSEVVQEVGNFISGSLSVSQIPSITSVYHFAKFLTFWKSTDHYNQRQMLSKCQGELTLCFQDLEAIGGSERDGLMLSQLSLMGIVFCHLLLNDENKLDPFELEQIKVLESNNLVVLLQTLYKCWLDMDLYTLEECLLQLRSSYSPWYDAMIDKVIVLCQSNKLWKCIAPAYSCIALQDLITKLKTKNTITMNRDQLLTLLMKSIAKDTAELYYKLDLVQDYIYFGDEYAVPLRSEEFSIVNPLSQKMGSEIIGKDEWLCNVANWEKPKVPKKITAIEFMDHMKANRMAISQMDLDHQQPTISSFLLKLSTLTHAQVAQNPSSLASTT